MNPQQKQILQFIGDKLITVEIKGQEALAMTHALQLIADIMNGQLEIRPSVESDDPAVAVSAVN